MKIFRKIWFSFLSIILCVAILTQTVSAVMSDSGTVYVKDMKLIYADSESQARSQLPEGYSLVPGNINDDTDRTGVYICYSTTEDENEALTDIKIMHESGGFERTDFKSSMDQAIDGVYALAEEMTTAVNEFAQNYKANIPGAVYAKDALNYFQYDENTLLGDFMISGQGTYKDYGQMILMCHEDILNPILSLLALGVQGKQGENWIDKLADVDPTAYGSQHNMKYRERATKLRPVLQQFNDLYCYVVGYYGETYTYEDLTNENDKELFAKMAENSELFKVIQTILQSYPVGVNSSWGEWGLTAEDMFAIGLNTSMNIYESYALLDCLTPGQEIMLRLTGPYNFIIGSQNTEEVMLEAKNRIVEQIGTDEKVPVWEGVNLEIFEEEVGLTNQAQRSIAAGKQYDIFAKDVDKLAQHHRNIASIVSSSFTIAASAVMVTKCLLVLTPAFFRFFGYYSVASAISAFASLALVSNLIFILGGIFMVGGIVCAIIVTFFLDMIIDWILKEDYERTTIPMYMVDEVVNKEGISTYAYYRRVDNVKTDDELDLSGAKSGSDINANKGYRWMAIYTSNKAGLGNPIEADFKVVKDSGVDQEGYVGLKSFGNINNVNLNSYADKNSAKFTAIYLFYAQDTATPVESEKMYISDIRVETDIHEDAVRKVLTDSGYLVFDHDFGCKTDEATLMGYKLTANPNDAVRDIRLLYNFSGTGITYGQLNYGAMGSIGNFQVMISSTNSNPAPPICSIKICERNDIPDASLGYEPVNEFSGGMAQPLGRSDYRIYFLPETTFTEGPDYVAGLKTDVYYFNTFSEISGSEYIKNYYYRTDKYDNNIENYRKFKLENYGEHFLDFTKNTHYYFQGKDNGDSHNRYIVGYKYTTTKNPYRALYGVSATKLNGMDKFNDHISYAGEGYVLAAAELSTNSYFYSRGDYIYAPSENTDEFGKKYGVYKEGFVDDVDYYTSENSPGKADATVDRKKYYGKYGTHSRGDVVNQDITQVICGKNSNALYITGYQSDRTPLTASDIIVTEKMLPEADIPANFTPVCYMIGKDSSPANLNLYTGEIVAGEYSTYGGLSSEKIKVTLYGGETFMYFRNEKTVAGKVVAQDNPKEGKYISGVFITSREEIREASLSSNPDLKCSHISKSNVENALLNTGATITYRTHINTNYDKDDDFTNANYTYVGITRSDDVNSAIRDIRLYVAKKGESPKKSIQRTITYNGMTFPVTYSLVSKASLTEQGNKSDANCAKERQVYVYMSSHPALGDPITDIRMSNWFSYEDFEPVLTMEDKHFITAYNENKKAGGASIFVDSDYFMHGNHLSFRREGGELPYVKNIMLAVHDDGGRQAVTKLLEAGYTDIIRKDLNEDAGGDYIYLGMTRTADKKEAIYDIMLTNDKKNPPAERDGYTLVSKLDLNKDAGGDYIYLYETRRGFFSEYSPLYDILAKGKSFKDSKTATENGVYCLVRAVNQENKVLDVNEDAGGEYIYLVKEYEVFSTLQVIGSMLGNGSIVAIISICVLALCVGGIVIMQKKKKKAADAAENKTTKLI